MIRETQHIITRAEVQANPDTLYLFGDNCMRKGYGGQAKEMRDEPNTHGIATKHVPNNIDSSFMTDDSLNTNKYIITRDIDFAIIKYISGPYKHLVIPPIGTGLARLPEKAPETYKWLVSELDRLKACIEAYHSEK